MSLHTLVFVALSWPAAGYIAWAWTNYYGYTEDQQADNDPKKWQILRIMMILGPIALLIPLIIGIINSNLRFGLRFK